MSTTHLTPLYSSEAIQERVQAIAKEINAHYKDESVVAICVLKGAFMFFSDLVKHLTCNPELDFIRIASYGQHAESSRNIVFSKDVDVSLVGKHVLIIEDIIDTGHSMEFLFQNFKERGAASLRLAVLVNKGERRECPITPDFVGFTLPKGFIVGYGLDYAERFRELPAIYEAQIEE